MGGADGFDGGLYWEAGGGELDVFVMHLASVLVPRGVTAEHPDAYWRKPPESL